MKRMIVLLIKLTVSPQSGPLSCKKNNRNIGYLVTSVDFLKSQVIPSKQKKNQFYLDDFKENILISIYTLLWKYQQIMNTFI